MDYGELTPEQLAEVVRLEAFFKECVDLFKQRGAKYGNSWHELSADGIRDLIKMKVSRANAKEDDLHDVAVYSWMAKEKREQI